MLAATVELLIEAGYQKTTIQAIARRAKVSAPAIYRRWATREMIIEDAVFELKGGDFTLPEPTDDLRADLLAWTKMFLGRIADPAARSAIPGLLSTWMHNDGVYARVVQLAELPARRALIARILHEVPGASDKAESTADIVFDLLVSATMIRGVSRGHEDEEQWCERIADALTALIGTIR
ncbi:TetR/AcrR family transcriptional regulator [Rhodococcus daqingensis]|uniref:TetR/AcrR family transcriptional regulator n=1 Tax=Rhodococcus daqingensis TaxID=2479363 RepID=A0ABW2RWT0_9NOCA